jgi:hypothetical protein
MIKSMQLVELSGVCHTSAFAPVPSFAVVRAGTLIAGLATPAHLTSAVAMDEKLSCVGVWKGE